MRARAGGGGVVRGSRGLARGRGSDVTEWAAAAGGAIRGLEARGDLGQLPLGIPSAGTTWSRARTGVARGTYGNCWILSAGRLAATAARECWGVVSYGGRRSGGAAGASAPASREIRQRAERRRRLPAGADSAWSLRWAHVGRYLPMAPPTREGPSPLFYDVRAAPGYHRCSYKPELIRWS